MTTNLLTKIFALFLLSFYAITHIQPKGLFTLQLTSPIALAGDIESESEEEENDDFLAEETDEDDEIQDIDESIEDVEDAVLEEILEDEDEEDAETGESEEEDEDVAPDMESIQDLDGSDNQAATDASVDNELR